MSADQARAQLRAAAWQLASSLGSNAAAKELDAVKAEIENEQWRRR